MQYLPAVAGARPDSFMFHLCDLSKDGKPLRLTPPERDPKGLDPT